MWTFFLQVFWSMSACVAVGETFLGVYLLGQLYRIIKLHQLYQIMSQCFSRVSVVSEHCQESCKSFNCSTTTFYTYYCHFYSTPANLVTQCSFNLYTSSTNEIKHGFLCFWSFLFLFGLKMFAYFPLGCLLIIDLNMCFLKHIFWILIIWQ